LEENLVEEYLLPADDGLPMRPAGSWAKEKLDYLARYMAVFETSMRQKWPIRNYVDLLAGPGKNQIRETGEVVLGSPLLALTTSHPFTGYFFVDLASANAQALTQRCSASPQCQQVDIRTGDCNLAVDQIVAELKRDEQRSLNLAFLDPEGLELKWATITRLASVQRMDLIINYPEGGLNRFMSRAMNAPGETAVDDFFGNRGWRIAYQEGQAQGEPNLHWRLIEFYKNQLQALGYKEVLRGDEVGGEPLMRNTKRKAPLYRLLFASKHPLGTQFWRAVTRRDLSGQQLLFRESSLQY
jgi:three-Cys-motif partner protein